MATKISTYNNYIVGIRKHLIAKMIIPLEPDVEIVQTFMTHGLNADTFCTNFISPRCIG